MPIPASLPILAFATLALLGTALHFQDSSHDDLSIDLVAELAVTPEISSVRDFSEVFKLGESSLVSYPSDNVLGYQLETRRRFADTIPYYNVCVIGEDGVSATIFSKHSAGHTEHKSPRLGFEVSKQNEYEAVVTAATAACENLARLAAEAS
jgi:hypothetical protein